MKRNDIGLIVNEFKFKSLPNDRFTSFDYCFNYFKSTNNLEADIEKSCLMLGFYLASWGMYRGSSFLLGKSIKYLEPTLEYFATLKLNKSVWLIDIDNYSQENIDIILEIYERIRMTLIEDKNADLTLITKILLGVFGFVPAFDTYFCNTFREISGNKIGFRVLNKNSLLFLKEFYDMNCEIIDKLSTETYTRDFSSGLLSQVNYPKAKIVDMYGFYSNEKMRSVK